MASRSMPPAGAPRQTRSAITPTLPAIDWQRRHWCPQRAFAVNTPDGTGSLKHRKGYRDRAWETRAGRGPRSPHPHPRLDIPLGVGPALHWPVLTIEFQIRH
jgi:hypothetical protein